MKYLLLSILLYLLYKSFFQGNRKEQLDQTGYHQTDVDNNKEGDYVDYEEVE